MVEKVDSSSCYEMAAPYIMAIISAAGMNLMIVTVPLYQSRFHEWRAQLAIVQENSAS